MAAPKVRRSPAPDDDFLVGIVGQADFACRSPRQTRGRVERAIVSAA